MAEAARIVRHDTRRVCQLTPTFSVLPCALKYKLRASVTFLGAVKWNRLVYLGVTYLEFVTALDYGGLLG